MGKIGCGYGSEWHLLRYLGRHRQRLREEILSITGGDDIRWLDFRFSNSNEPLIHDREMKGVEFLDEQVKGHWKTFWPQTGEAHNWDAVGQLLTNGNREWLLVEAKAHTGEIFGECGAKSKQSKQTIMDAMKQAMRSYNADDIPVEKWLKPYYQFCNRLTILHFLNNVCEPAVSTKLLMIYFYGDKTPDAPQSPAEWKSVLEKMYQEVGLTKQSESKQRIHTIYLSTNPNVMLTQKHSLKS